MIFGEGTSSSSLTSALLHPYFTLSCFFFLPENLLSLAAQRQCQRQSKLFILLFFRCSLYLLIFLTSSSSFFGVKRKPKIKTLFSFCGARRRLAEACDFSNLLPAFESPASSTNIYSTGRATMFPNRTALRLCSRASRSSSSAVAVPARRLQGIRVRAQSTIAANTRQTPSHKTIYTQTVRHARLLSNTTRLSQSNGSYEPLSLKEYKFEDVSITSRQLP